MMDDTNEPLYDVSYDALHKENVNEPIGAVSRSTDYDKKQVRSKKNVKDVVINLDDHSVPVQILDPSGELINIHLHPRHIDIVNMLVYDPSISPFEWHRAYCRVYGVTPKTQKDRDLVKESVDKIKSNKSVQLYFYHINQLSVTNEAVESELAYLMMQKENLSAKTNAIKMYLQMTGQLVEKKSVTHNYKPVGKVTFITEDAAIEEE